MMHMEYKVRLSDHNFVVGERHKLVPSVYGVCNVTPKGVVSRIRGKYSFVYEVENMTDQTHIHMHMIYVNCF